MIDWTAQINTEERLPKVGYFYPNQISGKQVTMVVVVVVVVVVVMAHGVSFLR